MTTTTKPTCANARCSRPVARKGQKCSVCRQKNRRSSRSRGSAGRGSFGPQAVLARTAPYSVNASYYRQEDPQPAEVQS